MQAHMGFLEAEPCEHSVVVISFIEISRHLEIADGSVESGAAACIALRMSINRARTSFGHFSMYSSAPPGNRSMDFRFAFFGTLISRL
jgi:hypothetical protein